MKNLMLVGIAAFFLLLGSASISSATVIDATKGPPLGSFDEAYIGDGSWQAHDNNKQSLYFTMDSFGLAEDSKIKDLADIRWHTFKGAESNFDWYLTIYTEPDDTEDDANWYGRRLTWEGLYANNKESQVNQWVQWQLSDESSNNQVTMYDGNRTNYGFYGGPTLADVIAGAIKWEDYNNSGSTETVNYAEETIKYLVWETGSGWADSYNGYLDSLYVELDDDTSATLDLEAVPEPTTWLLFGTGLLGLLAVGRKKIFNRGQA